MWFVINNMNTSSSQLCYQTSFSFAIEEKKRNQTFYFYFRITNRQCQSAVDTIGDWLALSLEIRKTEGCLLPDCKKSFIAMALRNIDTLYKKINLTIKFTNGDARNVQLAFCSYQQSGPGTVVDRFYMLKRVKRY